MPEVPPDGTVLMDLLEDICCHVQILFLAQLLLAGREENRARNYFYPGNVDCVNTKNNASPMVVQLQSSERGEGAHQTSECVQRLAWD